MPGTLRRVFDGSANAMLIADDDRRYVAANAAACRLLDVSAERLIGMRVDDFTSPELRGGIESLWREFMAAGTQAGDYELIRLDGSRCTVEYSATAHIEPGRHLSIFVHPVVGADQAQAQLGRRDVLLTAREQDVLGQVMLGATTAEIAERLYIAPETARSHVKHIIGKLGARNRAHAVAIALQRDPR
jgi:PAS domain S-box-containing protein